MIFVRSHTKLRTRDLIFLHVLPAVLVFAAVMLIIILNAQSAQRQNNGERLERATTRANEIESKVTARLGTYQEVATATSAFIKSSDQVTREEYERFIKVFDLNERYPGLQYVALARSVPAADIGAFEEQQRQNGAPDFKVFPDVTDDPALIVTYSVSHLQQNASVIGFNVLSEPVRAAATDKAVKTGRAVLSESVRLITNPNSGQGFVMVIPFYESEELPNDEATRLQSFDGAIVASFIARNFFDSLFKSYDDSRLAFSVSQGDNPPMYASSSFEDLSSRRGTQQMQRTLNNNDTNWTIRYAFTNGPFNTGFNMNVLESLVGGVLFSALLATLVFVLLLSRTRSLNHAEERDIQNAKDDLLSLASHQLRTPATSVKQYLGMVKDGFAGELNEQQSSLVNEAYASNERQLGIINEMLYVARADAGRIVLDKSSMQLNKLLRDIHKDQFPRAKSFQQRLGLMVPKMDVTICADAHYLRMAIENVVNNAIKYTPEKGSITVKLSRSKKDAVITISDTGVGIAKTDHRKIFDKFSRVPNELSTRTNGTGVGLYLSKQIVELHGGTITFISDAGKGTTFTITLPRLENE